MAAATKGDMKVFRYTAIAVLLIIISTACTIVFQRYFYENHRTDSIRRIAESISVGDKEEDIAGKIEEIKLLGGEVEFSKINKDGVRRLKILSYKGYNHYMRMLDIKNGVIVVR